MSEDILLQERSIYTLWDLCGDVGGLFGTLTIAGSQVIWLVSLIFGRRLNLFIFANLFKFEKKNQYGPERLTLEEALRIEKKRKPAEFKYSGWLLSCFGSRKEKLL